jgi:outer membrane protein assembly factor BamB
MPDTKEYEMTHVRLPAVAGPFALLTALALVGCSHYVRTPPDDSAVSRPPAAAAVTTDWPQWRGLERNGRSAETALLQEWPEGGPPLAWKASGLGGGYSSVAVAGERIFTMGDLGDGQYVLALSRADGRQLWKTRVGETHEDQYLGPRSTPTVDGDRIYAMSTGGDVVCLAAATGEKLWGRSLPGEFGGRLMKAMGTYDWKFAESPLVDGDRVIVTPGAPDAVLVALDKTSGEEIWRAAIPELGEAGTDGAGYSSVVVSEAGGVRQYVQLVGRGVIGVEAASGRFLWGYNRVANNVANIATPLVQGDLVFASTGYGTGSVLLRLAADGDGIGAEEVYYLEADTMQNHHGGLILDGGHVYTGTGHNKGFPLAIELATGKVAWGPIRNDGENSAAISYADGRIYMRYQNGLMILVEATPEEYRERGSFMIPEVEKESWSHPVVAGGKLYLREQDNLWVYDVRDTADTAAPAAEGGTQGSR